MSWQGIQGHDELVEHFRRSLERGRLGNTLLFVGPPGVGKRTFALKLAQALLCQERPAKLLDPCGRCDACVQVQAGTHPDLEVISKPADRSFIPIAAFIGAEGQRMREGLCHWIGLKPFMGGRKIAIIDDADLLNEEGANCLLKTLEEPPPRSLLILISTSIEKQLPTIRSRSQVVRFGALDSEIISNLLISAQAVANQDEAERLARFSGGSFERALELADPDLWSFRERLLQQLARLPADSIRLAQEVSTFVDQAGKEASARRSRTRQVIGFAVHYYSELMHSLAGAHSDADQLADSALAQATLNPSANTECAVESADRSIEALSQIERNVNQAILIEAWIDDLRAIAAGANS